MKKLLTVAVCCVVIFPAAVGYFFFSLREPGGEGRPTRAVERRPGQTGENLDECVRLHLGDYRVEVVPMDQWGRRVGLRIFDGDTWLDSWEAHPDTVFTRLGD